MTDSNSIKIDQLYRHHYGRMVATLTRIFGISNIEMIEDAVQDTFIKAMSQWKIELPPNPEGWLTKVAKNRAIDILRKIKSGESKFLNIEHEYKEETIHQFFMDYQIEDNQLRMIFTACHPELKNQDQIAFALKTIAGFGDNEIAEALLLKIETVKKRLTRARKTIREKKIKFNLPDQGDLKSRLRMVHKVLYLIFNEGFHSNQVNKIVRKDLCAEAIRLNGLILKKSFLRTGEGYAHLGFFCFHAARLDSKTSADNLLIDLKNQNRKTWNKDLIALGNSAMNKTLEYQDIKPIHYEAAIASEHIKADSFEQTDWNKILKYNKILHENYPSNYTALNLAVVYLQLHKPEEAKKIIDNIDFLKLENRVYLYYGIIAEYYLAIGNQKLADDFLDLTIKNTANIFEKKFIQIKKENLKLK